MNRVKVLNAPARKEGDRDTHPMHGQIGVLVSSLETLKKDPTGDGWSEVQFGYSKRVMIPNRFLWPMEDRKKTS